MKRYYSELADSIDRGNWHFESDDKLKASAEALQLAAAMDCMRSLRKIVRLLECSNTQRIPRNLQSIENLAREFWVKPKPKKRRKVAKRKDGEA